MAATEVTGDALTHDAEKIEQHDRDEWNLTHFTAGWARQSLRAQAAVRERQPKKIAVPVFFAWAERDLVASAPANEEFAERIEQDDKTVVERKGAHHEVLNETDRKELYDMIAEWILQRAK
jgi:alpha-beta hydrolase superfamily lysophospholipase